MGLFDSINRFSGDLTGGLVGRSSAERAVGGMQQLSEEAKKEGMGELSASFGQIREYLDPYLEDGRSALADYRQAIGAAPDAPVFEGFDFDPTKMEQNPAYQFIMDQTMQAADRLSAKNRGLTSGNRMIAAQEYAGGLASQEYGNEFQRQLQGYGMNEQAKMRNFDVRNLLNRQRTGDLSQLMTQGANMTGNLSQFRQNLGNQRVGLITNRAAESAAAQLLPVQERQNYIQGLMSAGGQVAGAMAGRPA